MSTGAELYYCVKHSAWFQRNLKKNAKMNNSIIPHVACWNLKFEHVNLTVTVWSGTGEPLWWFKYQQLGYYYAPIFTTRLANVINLVSSCPLTLAASRKKCSLLGFCCLQHDTSFTATTVHNEFRVLRSNMHQYTEMHLQFLAPCGPPHSHIHTEFDIQAIYSWCCNLSLFKWGFGGWQKTAATTRA